MEERSGFYEHVLAGMLDRGLMTRSQRVVVVAGGSVDAAAFRALGFEDVTISNLARDAAGVGGYDVITQDAENLDLDDDSYDWAVVSAGLHHCRSPHRALLEMLRVGRRGALAIEARDSALVRAAVRLGVTDEYELTAVATNSYRAGGVRDSPTPNYVYRWTEREVEKTVASAFPHAHTELVAFHALELMPAVVRGRWAPLARIVRPLLRGLGRLFPRQGNMFAFAVVKTGELQPWMNSPTEPDEAWIERRLGR